jgi:hypothetical protein
MPRDKWFDYYRQSNGRCSVCGFPLLASTWHYMIGDEEHLIPRSKGGNLMVAACVSCNRYKGDYDPRQDAASDDPAALIQAVKRYVRDRRKQTLPFLQAYREDLRQWRSR